MIHLRLIVPFTVTEHVLHALRDDPRVTHLSVLRGAGVEPEGDVVSCDVAREATSAVLDLLRAAGVDEHGAIALHEIDAAPTHAAHLAEQAAPGAPDDGIVWELVLDRAAGGARTSWAFYSFLTVACLIAAIAVLTDSPILVVGAMVIGPEFGPVAAMAVGLVFGRGRLVRDGAALLVTGFATAIAVTTLASLCAAWAGWASVEQLSGAHPLTGFIWRPDHWSVVVALLAGAVGALSITSGASNALVGVFISVTTVPAAGNLGLGIALWDPREITGSLTQLGVNLAGMLIAAVLVLGVQRVLSARLRAEPPRRSARPTA